MLPIIGVTMGEPKGIGPEVLAKALAIEEIYQLCSPLVFGSASIFKKAADEFGVERDIRVIDRKVLETGEYGRDELCIFDTSMSPSEMSVLESVKVAAELCVKGVLDAMVTGPVDKRRLNKVMKGKSFLGHTEYLADLTGSERVAMMLMGEDLRVVPVTTHCALSEVPGLLSVKKISDAIELTAFGLKKFFGIGEPRVGVAALNPHGGEQGLFGHEEEKLILPAVEKCRYNGIDVTGPMPADTLFYQALSQKHFDAIVTMYHDQALIPLKMLYFQTAVNFTLGLPIIRTSVDHGTAYDLVGKRQADPTSMVEAIRTAAHLSRF